MEKIGNKISGLMSRTRYKMLIFIPGFIDPPLNEFGEKQAETAGKALKDVIFHQAYSSDLKRAHR